MVTQYFFRPRNLPVLTRETVDIIISAWNKGVEKLDVTLDLGLTTSQIFFSGKDVILPNGTRTEIDELIGLKKGYVYTILEDGAVKRLAFYSDGYYYRLRPVAPDTAPTLEISGIHMHRVSGITPWEDTDVKVSCVNIRNGHIVLDICTGLGYTAIKAVEKGAAKVITIEKDVNVLKIAEYNPWSCKLRSEKIRILLGDAAKVVQEIPNNVFDRIVHDPPRLRLAGELYSENFYKELFRVLRPGGILFHYTGKPGWMSGKDVASGVSRRLRKAGFNTKLLRAALGVLAVKPRTA